MNSIEIPIDKWHIKWKEPPFWIKFDSKNKIFEVHHTKDHRLIIEQTGWIEPKVRIEVQKDRK